MYAESNMHIITHLHEVRFKLHSALKKYSYFKVYFVVYLVVRLL